MKFTEFKDLIFQFGNRQKMLPRWTTRSYQEVSQAKEDEVINKQITTKSPPLDSHPNRFRYSLYGLFISLIVLLFLLLIPTVFVHPSQHLQWDSCGDSPTTARERGCSFDLITFAWQLPNCYDAPLVDEFAAWEPWIFWANEHGNETVSVEIARKGDLSLWLPWQFHVVHCTFVWRQMHRAYEAGWIDNHSRSYHHTTHCQKMLLMDCRDEGRYCYLQNDTVVTSADLIYPACEKVDKRLQSKWDGFLTPAKDSYH